MSRASNIVLCSALPVPDGEVPEWIHLLPAGEITTQDGRGPYRVGSMEALAAQLNAGGKLAVDECHSTDLAAPKGAPAPARGWIVETEAREDGLWGKVKWTTQGRALMEDGAYNGISPVIVHQKDGSVVGMLRASLTNAPNLKGLTALHSQEPTTETASMDWKKMLIEKLGLAADADDAAIEAALAKAMEKPAMHSQDFDVTKDPAFIALQSELASAVTQLNSQSDATRRDKATAFIDRAIEEGRVGVKPLRDKYIARHMAEPAETEEFIAALPRLTGAALQGVETPAADKSGGLDAGDRQVMALLGVDETEYQESLKASGATKEAL